MTNTNQNTQDDFITEVVFRKEKDGQIIALFPYLMAGGYSITTYTFRESHGSANYRYWVSQTKLATETEYADLKRHLENLTPTGYNLKVIKKYNHDKYLAAVAEARKA